MSILKIKHLKDWFYMDFFARKDYQRVVLYIVTSMLVFGSIKVYFTVFFTDCFGAAACGAITTFLPEA